MMNDKILQSPSTALLSQNSNKRQVREIHFNVRDELGSQQIQCKPQEKVCRQTQLLEFLKKQIEKQPDPEINDIIAPIWNRTKTIDQQSNFIKAVIIGDTNKVQNFVHKINSFFNKRFLMIKNVERILSTGLTFTVENIPNLVFNIDHFNLNKNIS